MLECDSGDDGQLLVDLDLIVIDVESVQVILSSGKSLAGRLALIEDELVVLINLEQDSVGVSFRDGDEVLWFKTLVFVKAPRKVSGKGYLDMRSHCGRGMTERID
jgi:hypothetical protein